MESNDETSDFSLLPPHIIAQIFILLKFRQRLRAASTCKAWYFASCDPMIWKKTRVCLNRYHKIDRVDQLHRPFGTLLLQRIDFNQFTCYLDFFTKFGQYIRELEFHHCNLSLEQFYTCLILTPKLSSLTINVENEMFIGEANLTDEQLNDLKFNLQSVKSFAIALDSPNCDRLLLFMKMLSNLNNLKFSSTEYCYKYVYRNLFDYINMFTDEVKMNRLAIGELNGPNSENFLNDFLQISQTLNINELALTSIFITNIYDEYYVNFDEFCKKLSSVRILSMWSIGQNQLSQICQYMTQLTELNLSGIRNGNGNIRIIGNLRNLQKLNLSFSHYHEEIEKDYLLGIFNKLSQLKELRLEHSIWENEFNEICISCTNLIVLDLSWMRISRLAILFKNLTKLKRLRLWFWHVDRDFTVDCDITNLKLLEELEISNLVPGMTIDLIEKLPNLRPDILLNIKTKLEIGYDDPELENTYDCIHGLFD